MKIVIIGATGLIGSQTSAILEKEHEVVKASPSSGVNTMTGEGLDKAFEGAEVVIDVSNSPSFEDKPVMEFFTTSTQNIIAAAKKSGIKHYLALSVVGTQDLQESGYFRAKQAQENLIRESAIPFTIVHATQFFEFASGIVYMSTQDGKIVLPQANIQPIASADVAAFMAERAVSEPVMDLLEIGGPQKWPMKDWINLYLKNMSSENQATDDKAARYSGAAIAPDTLAPRKAFHIGQTKYEDWIAIPANRK